MYKEIYKRLPNTGTNVSVLTIKISTTYKVLILKKSQRKNIKPIVQNQLVSHNNKIRQQITDRPLGSFYYIKVKQVGNSKNII